MRTPPTESASVIDIDYANNGPLKEIFATMEAGESCRLILELQLISKSPASVRLGINKVISEGESYEGEEEDKEAEPAPTEPIVMRLRNATDRELMGYKGAEPLHTGPKGEVPETVTNSLGLTSNV